MFGCHKESDDQIHRDGKEASSNMNSESQYGQKNWHRNSIIDESEDFIESSDFTSFNKDDDEEDEEDENERIEQGELINSTTEKNDKNNFDIRQNTQSKKGNPSDNEIEEENKDVMIPSIHNSKKNLLTELKIHKNKVSSVLNQGVSSK